MKTETYYCPKKTLFYKIVKFFKYIKLYKLFFVILKKMLCVDFFKNKLKYIST